jgi:hypothetical protein
MTPLPELATVAVVFATGEKIPGYTADQMKAYGKAEYERGLLAAMNATLAFGKTGRVIAIVIRQLKDKHD